MPHRNLRARIRRHELWHYAQLAPPDVEHIDAAAVPNSLSSLSSSSSSASSSGASILTIVNMHLAPPWSAMDSTMRSGAVAAKGQREAVCV
jgi:hypothetical protein